MDKLRNFFQSTWLPVLVILTGLAARLLIATRGHNFDIDSCFIIAGITHHGGSVYASTWRYNYGPIWLTILHGLDVLARHDQNVFRYFIAGFLSLVDVGIYLFLRRRFGGLAAVLFFLNPVSVIITGYHSQFDNLAVLFGLVAVCLMGDEFDKPIDRKKFLGLVVLGISLTTKHVLFAFPCWLAVKQKGRREKLWTVLIPVLVFVVSFAPYWPEGSQGIIQNVFMYRSVTTPFFYDMFMPTFVQFAFNSQTVWLLMLVIFAFVYQKKNAIESLLLYTCLLVATAPATTNQYLAIPVAFVVTHLNLWTILYIVAATLHLATDYNGLGLSCISAWSGGDAIYMLDCWMIWDLWRRPIIGLFEKCVLEVENQLGRGK